MLNLALAQELVGLAAHHQKSYVYPNHETLRRNLRRHHKVAPCSNAHRAKRRLSKNGTR